MSQRDCLGADCREKNRSRNSTGVPRAGHAGEQGRRPRSPAHRAARPGNARYGSDACPELPPVRLRGDPRHGVGRAEVGRQSLSGADSAGISRRNADRPFRERPHRPDHPGLLHSAVHAQGSARSDLPGADDLVTDKSPHPWSSHQSEGKCRQRDAAHPSRDVEHLHLRHPPEHAAGSCTGITVIFTGSLSAQVYTGLVGLLAIGRTDGNLPLVTEKNIPIRNMALQYNFVFDRAGGLAQLNNPNWPQWVSTITPPKDGELANGTYRPLLAPVNFNQSKPGTKYFTVWYAGPLSIHNHRGQLPVHPQQSAAIHRGGRQSGQRCAGESIAPGLPTGRAIHGQRPVSAGHQEQGGPDRDLGARECERLCLHERPAHGNGDWAASADRHRRPGRQSLYQPSTIRPPTTAPGCSFHRRAGSRLP